MSDQLENLMAEDDAPRVVHLDERERLARERVQVQARHLVAPPGQNFMGIGLMPHIPDQLIPRRVKHVMQRNRQFHHAKPRTQMPAGLRYARWM